MNLRRYAWNVLVWLDQGVNTLAGGDPDETVSSRAAKAAARGQRWGCVLCRWLDKLDPGHCADNIELDEGGNAAS
jgi:hypothetical protein